jgi:hypothetical protein
VTDTEAYSDKSKALRVLPGCAQLACHEYLSPQAQAGSFRALVSTNCPLRLCSHIWALQAEWLLPSGTATSCSVGHVSGATHAGAWKSTSNQCCRAMHPVANRLCLPIPYLLLRVRLDQLEHCHLARPKC